MTLVQIVEIFQPIQVFLSKEIDNGKFYAMKVLTKENILRKVNMAKVLMEKNVLDSIGRVTTYVLVRGVTPYSCHGIL